METDEKKLVTHSIVDELVVGSRWVLEANTIEGLKQRSDNVKEGDENWRIARPQELPRVRKLNSCNLIILHD